MGRPFKHQRAKPFIRPSDSLLVLGDSYRRSVGYSRSTLHRYIKLYGWTPCWVGGRLFLQKSQLVEWEQRAIRGEFGGKPLLELVK